MEELLRWDGVWTWELIETMVPVAEEIEADEAQLGYAATAAAAGGLFSPKAPKAFLGHLKAVKDAAARRRAPVETKEERDQAADLLESWKRMGMFAGKPR